MLLLLYMILIKVFNKVEKGIVLSIQVSFIYLFGAIYGGGQLEGQANLDLSEHLHLLCQGRWASHPMLGPPR